MKPDNKASEQLVRAGESEPILLPAPALPSTQAAPVNTAAPRPAPACAYRTWPEDHRLCWSCGQQAICKDKPSTAQRNVTVGWIGQGSNMHVPCTISGAQFRGLVDTGATITLLRPCMLPPWGESSEATCAPTSVCLKIISGQVTPMQGQQTLVVELGGFQLPHTVWLTEIVKECILGANPLAAMGATLDLDRGQLSVREGIAMVQL
ncbi:UNVERIFIED_CONTAM: hypothetical protein FKN15_006856 [Acipenser sinensis]